MNATPGRSSEAIQRALAAASEPARFRIIALLAGGPCAVGEIADRLGALQPQTTKHVQALQAAGLVRVHRTGRRRIVALAREEFAVLSDWLAALAAPSEDDEVLTRYSSAAVAAEERRKERGAVDLDIRLVRRIPVPPAQVWRAWAEDAVRRRWWAPRHFTVERCVLDPTPGGQVQLQLREGDARYASSGVVLAASPGRRLDFTLVPLGEDGRPLLDATFSVALTGEDDCRLEVGISARASDPESAPLLAGLEPGWSQMLDALEEVLREG